MATEKELYGMYCTTFATMFKMRYSEDTINNILPLTKSDNLMMKIYEIAIKKLPESEFLKEIENLKQ